MLIKIIIIILILAVLAILIVIYENQALSCTTYKVESERLPEAANGLRLAVLSDLHDNEFGTKNIRLIQAIQEQNPDYILIAGDMINGEEGYVCTFDVVLPLVEQLSKQYKIFYAYGNHEQRVVEFEMKAASLDQAAPKDKLTFGGFIEKIKELGVVVLYNESVELPLKDGQSIRLTGGIIDRDYFKRLRRPKMTKEYLDDLIGRASKEKYQILIAHNPMYFEQYAQWGADLVLSGHIHGGMVRLPFLGGVISPQMKLFPEFDAGQFNKQRNGIDSQMIVSRGLGIHTIKIRFLNRPELVMVQLKKKGCSVEK